MEEVYEFLKKCGTFFLATVDGDQPRVRPFGALDVFEGKLYIHSGKGKKVSNQMHQNPKIEICAMKGDTWIRIEATAVEDERLSARKHMHDTNPELNNMYSPDDGKSEVFYLQNAKATICSFSAAPKVIQF